jgi:hypothetical protein
MSSEQEVRDTATPVLMSVKSPSSGAALSAVLCSLGAWEFLKLLSAEFARERLGGMSETKKRTAETTVLGSAPLLT